MAKLSKQHMQDAANYHLKMCEKLGIEPLNFPYLWQDRGETYLCTEYEYLGKSVLGIDAWVLTWKSPRRLDVVYIFARHNGCYSNAINQSWRAGCALPRQPKERNLKKRNSHTVPEEWEF